MKHKNYYEILEVSQTASYTEIKRSYYSLCKRYHPDINPKTANLFKNINEAYEVLMNPIARREYDESLKAEEEQATNQEQYSDTGHDSYYTNAQYYQDPSKEPIMDILRDLHKYRFENAMKGIWNRNIFVLYTTTIFSYILILATLSERAAHTFNKSLRPIRASKHYWIRTLWQGMKDNTLWSFIWWSILLSAICFGKSIYICGKIIMFIYTRILRPLFLPLGIIIASIIHSSNRNGKRY